MQQSQRANKCMRAGAASSARRLSTSLDRLPIRDRSGQCPGPAVKSRCLNEAHNSVWYNLCVSDRELN